MRILSIGLCLSTGKGNAKGLKQKEKESTQMYFTLLGLTEAAKNVRWQEIILYQ
jgi:hypothetical protein